MIKEHRQTKYYLPLWIDIDHKDGDCNNMYYLIKVLKPHHKSYYSIMYTLGLEDMSITRADPGDYGKGIQVAFTNSEINKAKKYIKNHPKFLTKINRLLRIKKLTEQVKQSNYLLYKELNDFITDWCNGLTECIKRSKHLIRLLNRNFYYLKPENIYTILDYQKINADVFDSSIVEAMDLDDPEFAVDHLDDDTYDHLDDEAFYNETHDSNREFLHKMNMMKPLIHN